MHLSNLFKLLSLGGAMALVACSPGLDTTRVPVSVTSPAGSSLQAKVTNSINAYRASIGKPALARHSGLEKMARQHCEFMARNRGKFSLGSANISHYGFEERSLMAQRAYGMGSVAENIAGGQMSGDIAGQITQAWINSSGHRYNLKQNWDATGIAVHVTDDGMVYATQIFATKNNSQMAFTDRLTQF